MERKTGLLLMTAGWSNKLVVICLLHIGLSESASWSNGTTVELISQPNFTDNTLSIRSSHSIQYFTLNQSGASDVKVEQSSAYLDATVTPSNVDTMPHGQGAPTIVRFRPSTVNRTSSSYEASSRLPTRNVIITSSNNRIATATVPYQVLSAFSISSNGMNYGVSNTYSHFNISASTPSWSTRTSAQDVENITASSSNNSDLHSYIAPSFTQNSDLHPSIAPSFTPSSNLPAVYSSFGDYSGVESSENVLSAVKGIFTLNSAYLENKETQTHVYSSDESDTLVQYQNTLVQKISVTSAGLSTHQLDDVISPTAVISSLVSSTIAFCCQQTDPLPVLNNDEAWAVPVTVCLSILLFATWIILLVMCRRSRSRSVGSRSWSVHDEDDVAGIRGGNQQWQSENTPPLSATIPSSRQKNETAQKVAEQHKSALDRNYDQRDADFYLRISYGSRQVTSCSSKDADVFEMDNMSSTNRDKNDSRNSNSINRECRIDNEAMSYDNYSFVPISPEHSIGHLSQRNNSHWSDDKTSKDRISYLSEFNHHIHLQASDRKHKHEPVDKTSENSKDGATTQDVKSFNPQLGYTYEKSKEHEEIELQHLSSRYSNKGYNPSDHSNRNYVRGDNKDVELTFTSNGEHSVMSYPDIDSPDNVYRGENTMKFTIAENKPSGILKSVSFDDTHLRVDQDKIYYINKKTSRNRKISTTSESATTYLVLPEEGFMTMASTYETVDNLAEIGDYQARSRFFIGPYSDNTSILEESFKKSDEHFQLSPIAGISQMNELTNKNVSKDKATEGINAANKEKSSEIQDSKPADDYIFPIMRKANMKIMAERQHRKLIGKSSNESSDGEISLADVQTQTTHVTGRKSQDGLRERDSHWSMDKTSVQSSAMADDTNPERLRRVSHPQTIPKIILTSDKNETKIERENTDELHTSSAIMPARTRRIARANNPFLIEVPSSTVDSSEKVRRSSAPSMARSKESLDNFLTVDRMVRSASGDHLCLSSNCNQFDRRDFHTVRSWSSDFFDSINNAKSDNRVDDERLKKMIDDRYDALFNNKIPQLTTANRSEMPSSRPDLSERIMKFMARPSHWPISRDAVVNADYTGYKEITDSEIRSRFRPIIEVGESGFPLDKNENSNPSAISNRTRKLSSDHHSHFQMGNASKDEFSSTESTEKESGSREDETSMAEFSKHVDSNFTPSFEGGSARPSLASGTDGQDSDADNRPDSQASWSSDINPNESQPHPFAGNDNYRIGFPNTGKVPISKIHWESFEEDPEEVYISSSTSASGKLATVQSQDKCKVLSRVSEHPSQELANEDKGCLANEGLGNDKQSQPLSPLIKEVNTDGRDVTDKVSSVSYMHVDTSPADLLNESTSVLSSVKAPSSGLSDQSLERFEDNFNIDNIDKAKAINPAKPSKINGNQLREQGQNNAFTFSIDTQANNLETAPKKPQRRAKNRGQRNERLKRPPSPYMGDKRKVASATDDPKDISRGEDKSHSMSLLNNKGSSSKPRLETLLSSSSVQRRPGLLPKRTTSRSLCLDEPSDIDIRKVQRAITLETDKLTSYFTNFSDWSNLFGDKGSMFVTSANNTVLEHNSLEDVNYTNNSPSEPKTELNIKPTSSNVKVVKKSIDQNRSKLMILDEDNGSRMQISSI